MEAFMSMITPYGCNFVIRNWGACWGGLISIAQYNALFSLLGTNFGGNGRTSFGLPDLRGRSPAGYGNGPGLNNMILGQKGGVDNSPAAGTFIEMDWRDLMTTPAHTA